MLAPSLLLLIKASLVLAAALVLGWLLRRSTAVVRHQMWSASFVALLAVPGIALLLPGRGIEIPVIRGSAAPDSLHRTAATSLAVPAIDSSLLSDSPVLVLPPRQSTVSSASRREAWRTGVATRAAQLLTNNWREILLGIWIAGVLTSLAALIVSLVRASRVMAAAAELKDADWRTSIDRVAARFAITRPIRVLSSAHITTPMAGGLIRPLILVPADAGVWSADVRDIVLTHETAHLARRDPLRLLIARLTLAFYWMHPLAWVAARRASAACEQACDEAVLDSGVRPSSYANVLLDFADRPAAGLSAALPIVRRTHLETRLMAILDQPARARRARPVVVVTGTLALAMTLAAAQPVERVRPSIVSDRVNQGTESALRPSVQQGVATPPVTETVDGADIAHAIASSETGARAGNLAALPERCSVGADGRDFSGSISMSDRGGTTVIHEQIGRRGNDRIIEKTFEGMRVCALGREIERSADLVPSAWSQEADLVVLETRTSREVRHMEIERGRVTYTVNDAVRPIDADANAWRSALFALLDDSWRLSGLRGRVSSLRGEISSVHGMRSSLQGEISSLRGQVSSMRGEISSWQGRESSLRGEISSIRGQLSSLQGSISSERGAISSLEASRWEASAADRERIAERIRRHEQRIRDLEQEIRRFDSEGRVREVEARIASLDFDGEIARIERRIREFDLDAQVAAVQRRIAELDVEGQVRGIEREIDGLNADDNARQLESRISAALTRLRALTR